MVARAMLTYANWVLEYYLRVAPLLKWHVKGSVNGKIYHFTPSFTLQTSGNRQWKSSVQAVCLFIITK